MQRPLASRWNGGGILASLSMARPEVMVSGGMLFRGRIADVSSSGCFIATELYLHMKPGTPVELAFRAGRVTLRMGGTARSVRSGSGAAFAFGSMSDYTRAGLDRLIGELERQRKLKENEPADGIVYR